MSLDKSVSLSILLAASASLLATPADAFSLRDTAHGESLFQIFNSLANIEGLGLEENTLGLKALRADSLYWEKGSDPVDVFFVNEGSGGYRDQLFYTANGTGLTKIFDDIASPESIQPNSDGPLKLGDGVRLGSFSQNTLVDFILKGNGKDDTNGYVYSANIDKNPDKLQHVIAFEYFDKVMQESWVILGFENLYGVHYSEGGISDRDFNDVVFAVKGLSSQPSLPEAKGTPEPTMMLGMLAISALMGVTRRR